MQLFESMYVSSHCRGEKWSVFGGWISWFLGRQLARKWLCTTQNWQFCVILEIYCNMSSFSEKTVDHLFGSASCINNFCWIWLIIMKHSYSRLLFTFGLIRINLRFITCHDVVDVFRSTVIVFLEHFLRLIDKSLFLSNWQIVWDQTRKIFLTVKCLFSRKPIYMTYNWPFQTFSQDY